MAISFHLWRGMVLAVQVADNSIGNPVNANNGSLVSCGHRTWYCEPDVAFERCKCGTGKGTFSLPPGLEYYKQ